MEHNTIFIQLSSQTALDFGNVAQFVDNLKCNCTRLKEISTKDVLD